MKPDSYYQQLDKRTREYKDWKKSKKSKGLGDTVEKITKKTGIKKAVEWFSDKTGIDCGCDERKEKLNKLFSYSKKANCMSKVQFDKWKAFKDNRKNSLNVQERDLVATIHAELFNHKKVEPCTCNPKAWISMISEIDKVYSTY